MTKESFIIYKSFYEPIKTLSDEQIGRLFRGIFNYQINKVDCNDSDILMAFLFFKNQFELDDKKYIDKCEKNRANASVRKQSLAMAADNDNENENEKVKDNVNDNVELIYNSYPSRCVVKGSSTGKTSKNKDKIKSLLKNISADKLLSTIGWYVNECKSTNTYMKNFSTFLNNLPDISEDSLTSTYPQDNVKPQGKIRQ